MFLSTAHWVGLSIQAEDYSDELPIDEGGLGIKVRVYNV